MNILTRAIPITVNNPVDIIPLSDMHVGNSAHDKDLFRSDIRWIKKNNAHTILLGDHIDAISQADRRFENDSIAFEFKDKLDNLHHEQTMSVYRSLKPVKERILGIMGGNHEHTVKQRYSYDSANVLAEALNTPLMSDPSWIRLKLVRSKTSIYNVDIFCSHGLFIGGGKKYGSKVNNMRDIAAGFDADIYLGGHSHTLFEVSDIKLGINQNNQLIEKRRHYINTGSFMRTYKIENTDSWASRKVFLPTRVGCARINIRLKKKGKTYYPDIHVSV